MSDQPYVVGDNPFPEKDKKEKVMKEKDYDYLMEEEDTND